MNPTADPNTARLKAARRQRKSLLAAREAQRLERANTLMEGAGDWVGGIYGLLDRLSSWQQDFGGATFAGLGFGGMASTINDRRYGKSYPIYQTEVDLQTLRFPSRLLLATNGYAQGMLEGLTSYVCGDGFTQEVRAKDGKEDQVPREILAKLNAVLDDFRERNDWHGGEQPGLEEEIFQRSEEDGECFLHLHEDDAGLTWVNTIEPEQVTAPTGSDMDYLFGIRTERGQPQHPLAYWVRGWNTALDGDEYDAAQIVHLKTNVKRQMKRGVPSFSFGVADTMTLADKLRKALGTGAAMQAGIAFVRQWDSASESQVQGFGAAFADYTAPGPNGTTVNVTKYGPGGIEDIPKGMVYANPPNAVNAPAHVQILQACLRGGTARWNAPEWIGSGDASNNNFASALVADAPFTKRTIRTQRRHERVHKRIFEFALETRCARQGTITAVRADGTVISMPWDELRKLVEVVVTAPSVEVRNKLEEAQANQIRVGGGWKSPQTVQAEEGLDSDREQANLDAWRERNPPQAQPAVPPTGGPGGKPPIAGDGELRGKESGKTPLRESKDASGHEHDDATGRFGSSGGGKPLHHKTLADHLAEHKAAVVAAIAAGEQVPDEVLAAYPDLKRKPEKKPAAQADPEKVKRAAATLRSIYDQAPDATVPDAELQQGVEEVARTHELPELQAAAKEFGLAVPIKSRGAFVRAVMKRVDYRRARAERGDRISQVAGDARETGSADAAD